MAFARDFDHDVGSPIFGGKSRTVAPPSRHHADGARGIVASTKGDANHHAGIRWDGQPLQCDDRGVGRWRQRRGSEERGGRRIGNLANPKPASGRVSSCSGNIQPASAAVSSRSFRHDRGGANDAADGRVGAGPTFGCSAAPPSAAKPSGSTARLRAASTGGCPTAIVQEAAGADRSWPWLDVP